MNTRRRTRMTTVALSLSLAPYLIAPWVEAAERRLAPGYPRREAAQRSTADAPTVRTELPRSLRLSGTPDETAASAKARAASSPRPGREERDVPGGSHALETQATRAGVWAATEVISLHGIREYWRVGFHAGQRAALRDERLGRWDFLEGRRLALGDPQAYAAGHAHGVAEAEWKARDEAERQVAEQFSQLSHWPRFQPRPGQPGFAPRRPDIPAPRLEEVLGDYPPEDHRGLSKHARPFFASWGHDGRSLVRYESHDRFYDAGWPDASAAFELWLRDRRRSAFYRALERQERRERFEMLFRDAFLDELSARAGDRLLRAYETGFDDGWSYGAFVRAELEFRRGYREGFVEAWTTAAARGFEGRYDAAYDRAYADSFTEWAENPKPRFGEILLVDGNDDGVFQPGETLALEYEAINYGGREGRFEVRLEGRALAAPWRADIVLPARNLLRPGRIPARIDPHVPTRTRATLDLRLDDLSVQVPLEVSHPLQLDRDGIVTHRDNLAGAVVVEVPVSNTSRRALGVSVIVTSSARPGLVAERRLDALAPGGRGRVRLELSGLPVLDLLAGDVSLAFEVRGGGVTQDAWTRSLPGVALDLRDEDLLAYAIGLARGGAASPGDVARLRELLLVRLREDWRVAVRQGGNPYKWDFRHGGTSTALGRLVQAFRGERDRARRPEVFAGLSEEVLELARSLPGVHPFLRKYARKLARELA